MDVELLMIVEIEMEIIVEEKEEGVLPGRLRSHVAGLEISTGVSCLLYILCSSCFLYCFVVILTLGCL